MQSPVRVLWLLNHTTLRKFEITQLAKLGIHEIFAPKSFPYDEGNLSASVTYELDSKISIPSAELDVLNAQNWYGTPSLEAWTIANQYFDLAFIGFFPQQIDSLSRNFGGSIVLRVFGLSKGFTYSDLLYKELGPSLVARLQSLGDRFWFGAGYDHLTDIESTFLKHRNCFLPVGLNMPLQTDRWTGDIPKLLFVCPRIATSPYYRSIYKTFTESFKSFDYVIGGAQPIAVDDARVIGFVSRDEHEANMRRLRVMFYHSSEPNHIHYHPFEAIAAGMPLVYMANGLLDRFGGVDQPGRCQSIENAHQKIQRILKGDWPLINRIRKDQMRILEPLRPESCAKPWQEGLSRILTSLNYRKASKPIRDSATKRKRIAVIVPVGYRGGSLRGAKLLAQALWVGSRQAAQDADIVLAHLDDPTTYKEEEFDDLYLGISRRPYAWKTLDAASSRRAMALMHHQWEPSAPHYLVPDDGMKQFMDCDLWLIISDRLSAPILPAKPYISMVYDYLQRYVNILPKGADQPFLDAARTAQRVLVTTKFTRGDALQYAGVDPDKLALVPMLAPTFKPALVRPRPVATQPYFLWTTNAAPHKNHLNALLALREYYDVLGGTLECRVTGVDTRNILTSEVAHLHRLRDVVGSSRALQSRVRWLGELPDEHFRGELQGAAFLMHAGRIDNGTFSVIEAAHLGVPALSSGYPAMHEIDEQFHLNLTFMDPHEPRDMAAKLRWMEDHAADLRSRLPDQTALGSQAVEQLAPAYWRVVRECL